MITVDMDGGLTLRSIPGIPLIAPGNDVARIVADAADAAGLSFGAADVVVIASKLLSRAEGRFVDLGTVEAGAEARKTADITGHDPRLVELILRESVAVSRTAPYVLIVRHRLGHVAANAGIDASNAHPPGSPPGEWVLLLPADPDGSAARLRAAWGVAGVVVTDSCGRPFREGTVGLALGVAGLPTTIDHVGRRDLCGRTLVATVTALGDQVAAAADLVAGQADEGRGVTLVRGLRFAPDDDARARQLQRPPAKDLYA